MAIVINLSFVGQDTVEESWQEWLKQHIKSQVGDCSWHDEPLYPSQLHYQLVQKDWDWRFEFHHLVDRWEKLSRDWVQKTNNSLVTSRDTTMK